MKVYQLIYTNARHRLSDSEHGLENFPGMGVYSCSQGLTKSEIDEIVRYCGYKLPKNSTTEYSKTPCDPSVPELFPKSFRTVRLSENKTAVIQTVYSGCDFDGNPGNFFAHAYIFEKTGKSFRPEDYYGSSDFRTHLTQEEIDRQLVCFLPVKDDLQKDPMLDQAIYTFIDSNKKKMSFILQNAMNLLRGNGKTHLLIETSAQEESDYYLLSLKKLLPEAVSDGIGISTYNLFLPSNKQTKIIFHATVKGKNNITPESIQSHTNCVYIDLTKLDTAGIKPIKLFDFPVDKLNELYEKYSIRSFDQLDDWFDSYEKVSEPGIGQRLTDIKDTISRELFIARCKSIFSVIDDAVMDPVRFELLHVMYENIHIIASDKDEISKKYVYEGIRCIAEGNPQNMENLFKGFEDVKQQATLIYNELDQYMKLLETADINEKSGMLLLRLFAVIKQGCIIETWKEFFKENHQYLSIFVDIAACVMINNSFPATFTAPNIWTAQETAEIIVYFDSSTQSESIKRGCRKYILNNPKINWASYGIVLNKVKKSKEARENDLLRIRKMLSDVGYCPFQKTAYTDLKYDIVNEMNVSENPLLITRLLYSYYMWQAASGQLADAQKAAQAVSDLILDLKENQYSCYQYVFPNLALEILSTPGHYHELMINSETMEPDFWSWFLIGFKRCQHDEGIRLTYQRVFDANEDDLKRLPIYTRLYKTINH